MNHDPDKRYSQCEIRSLLEGGYLVIQHPNPEGRFGGFDFVAAFSTMPELLKWLGKKLVDKAPVLK